MVLNLGVTFTRHMLFPDTGGFERFALVVSIAAFLGMTRFKGDMIPAIVGCAAAGVVWKLIISGIIVPVFFEPLPHCSCIVSL